MYDFSKEKRLLTKSAYNAVFKQAKKIIAPGFIFLYTNNKVGHARLGMAISKKNISKAHDRNRIKRLLRETFRVSTLPSVDVIVLSKHGVATSDNSVIIANLSKAWDKLSALHKK